MVNATPFTLREGQGVFSPKDLVELGRPGAGVANHAGDLVLVSYSQFSFKDNVCVFNDTLPEAAPLNRMPV
jgi:hypothetical protein